MKPGLGLKQQPKQQPNVTAQCLGNPMCDIGCHKHVRPEKKEPAAAAAAAPAAEPETIDLS